MKKNVPQQKFNPIETHEISLDGFCKLEQAELVTRLSINANLDRNETQIAMCCVSDLLYDAINLVQ